MPSDREYFSNHFDYSGPGNSNHGKLELTVSIFPHWKCDDYYSEWNILHIQTLNPGYSLEEEKALKFLSFWLRQRGLNTELAWYPERKKERKVLSNEQRYKRAVTKWRNRLQKENPLFWENEWPGKLKVLKERYNVTCAS